LRVCAADEEDIVFPPTYRYERGTRETYNHLKVKKTGVRVNVPSWCDRVLWRSYPETHAVCLAYGEPCTVFACGLYVLDRSPFMPYLDMASYEISIRVCLVWMMVNICRSY